VVARDSIAHASSITHYLFALGEKFIKQVARRQYNMRSPSRIWEGFSSEEQVGRLHMKRKPVRFPSGFLIKVKKRKSE
jgi:hypothetical protein